MDKFRPPIRTRLSEKFEPRSKFFHRRGAISGGLSIAGIGSEPRIHGQDGLESCAGGLWLAVCADIPILQIIPRQMWLSSPIINLARALAVSAVLLAATASSAQYAQGERGDMGRTERGGFDIGWIGLIGLGGLAGLMRDRAKAGFVSAINPTSGRV